MNLSWSIKKRVFGQKTDKPTKKPTKEAMIINTVPVKISARDKNRKVKRIESSQEVDIRGRTLKELEEKTYHFLDSNVIEVVGEPNYRGGDGIIGDSSFNNDEEWKLVI
ncbi:unnamed protein product [Prunus brigantina]